MKSINTFKEGDGMLRKALRYGTVAALTVLFAVPAMAAEGLELKLAAFNC